MRPPAVGVHPDGVVLALAYVQAEEHPERAGHPDAFHKERGCWSRSGIDGRQPRYGQACPARGGPASVSGPWMPPGSGDISRIAGDRGETVMPGLVTRDP
nr:hypothetical protein GCM10020241_59980 [Streptoalloteichus tenebrarius]